MVTYQKQSSLYWICSTLEGVGPELNFGKKTNIFTLINKLHPWNDKTQSNETTSSEKKKKVNATFDFNLQPTKWIFLLLWLTAVVVGGEELFIEKDAAETVYGG